jgi:hypothetical protein
VIAIPTDTVLLAPSQTPAEAIDGFQVRPKGAKDAWARVAKEIDMFKTVIEQAGIKKL